MKRRALSLLLAVMMLCFSFPLTASAANETSASTTVSYTQAAPSGESPEFTSTYEINIPASISLNDGRELAITADYVNLAPGKVLIVTIDSDRTFGSDGLVHLTNSNTGDEITANINRYSQALNAGELIAGEEDHRVALFGNGNTQPFEYGKLYLNKFVPSDLPPGTYTGTIYFNIAVIDS